MNALVKFAKTQVATLQRLIEPADRTLPARLVPELAPDAIAFLDPIDELCAEPPPLYAKSILYPIATLVLALILIGSLINVDIVVTANGRINTDTPPIQTPSFDRAILREVKVHVGDQVHQGEVLAILDPTFARADLGSLAAQRSSWQAQRDRLEAELADRPYKLPEKANTDQTLQATLYEQRLANYRSRLKVFSEDIERLNASIKSTEQDNVLLASQLSVSREVEDMRLQLQKSQYGSKLNFLEAQSLRMRTERDYQDSMSHLAELKHQMQSRLAEQQAFVEDWRRQILESLASAQTQLTMVEESLSKATLVNDLVVVTAQADGVILDMAQRSVGSILQQGESLFTILPNDAKLVADINISSSDVGSTKAGDEVLVKVDAFPYGRHGLVKGKLLYITEASYSTNNLTGQMTQSGQAQGGAAYHPGRVELTDTQLRNMPEGAHLMPGMTLRAEIKTGTRSIVGFFLTPVTKGLGEAMREP